MVRAPVDRGIYKDNYGQALECRPQLRPRIRRGDQFREDAFCLEVLDWEATALDRGRALDSGVPAEEG